MCKCENIMQTSKGIDQYPATEVCNQMWCEMRCGQIGGHGIETIRHENQILNN